MRKLFLPVFSMLLVCSVQAESFRTTSRFSEIEEAFEARLKELEAAQNPAKRAHVLNRVEAAMVEVEVLPPRLRSPLVARLVEQTLPVFLDTQEPEDNRAKILACYQHAFVRIHVVPYYRAMIASVVRRETPESVEERLRAYFKTAGEDSDAVAGMWAEHLNSKDVYTRIVAARALGEGVGNLNREALDRLVVLTRDPNRHVRAFSVEALSAQPLVHTAYVQELLDIAATPSKLPEHDGARAAALRTLGNRSDLADQREKILVEALAPRESYEVKRVALEAIRDRLLRYQWSGSREPVLKASERIVFDTELSVQVFEVLGALALKHPAALDAIARRFGDETQEELVRALAARTLANVLPQVDHVHRDTPGSDTHRKMLLAALEKGGESSETIRAFRARALGALFHLSTDREASKPLELLRLAYKDASDWVRLEAFLGVYGRDESLPPELVKTPFRLLLTPGKNRELAWAAIEKIDPAKMPPAFAEQFLLALYSSSRDESLPEELRTKLTEDFEGPKQKALAARVREQTSEENTAPWVRIYLALFDAQAEEKGRQKIIFFLKSTGKRTACVEQAFLTMARHSEKNVYAWADAMYALSVLPAASPATAEYAISMLTDAPEGNTQFAQQVISQLGVEQQLAALPALMHTRSTPQTQHIFARATQRDPERVIQILGEGIRSENPAVKLHAVAQARYAPKELFSRLTPSLLSLVQDTNQSLEVRRAVFVLFMRPTSASLSTEEAKPFVDIARATWKNTEEGFVLRGNALVALATWNPPEPTWLEEFLVYFENHVKKNPEEEGAPFEESNFASYINSGLTEELVTDHSHLPLRLRALRLLGSWPHTHTESVDEIARFLRRIVREKQDPDREGVLRELEAIKRVFDSNTTREIDLRSAVDKLSNQYRDESVR